MRKYLSLIGVWLLVLGGFNQSKENH